MLSGPEKATVQTGTGTGTITESTERFTVVLSGPEKATVQTGTGTGDDHG